MTLSKAARNTFFVLSSVSSAFAQWSTSAVPLATAINMGNTGGIFADSSTDVDMEGPHTAFEKLERRLAASSPRLVDSDTRFAPGLVSAAELRHPVSREGATLLRQAEKYASKGKHKEAIEVLNKALQDSSAASYARSLLGAEYLKIFDPDAAIVHLKEAIVLQPSHADNYSNLGYALCLTGDRAAGERKIREAIGKNPYFSKAHFLLGIILLDKPTPEARDHLLLVESEIPLARLALAVYYERRGETAGARQELKAYMESNHSTEPEITLEKQLAGMARVSRPTQIFGFPPARD
jgi:tetratricopeptide (TPR) repeat protein